MRSLESKYYLDVRCGRVDLKMK